MSGLINKAFWVALFLVCTFAFTVLFDHGTEDYVDNAKKEFEALKEMVMQEDTKAKKK